MGRRTEIITSPTAEHMLGMVTNDFYNDAYIALWLFEVIGREYDEITEWVVGLRNEIHPATCTWSIGIWEWVYGLESDPSLPLEQRRQRIIAHIAGKSAINPEVIRRGVAALAGGAEVAINERIAPYTFEVVIEPGSQPVDFGEIWRYVRRIKQSHMSFVLEEKSVPEFEVADYLAAVAVEHIREVFIDTNREDEITTQTYKGAGAIEQIKEIFIQEIA